MRQAHGRKGRVRRAAEQRRKNPNTRIISRPSTTIVVISDDEGTPDYAESAEGTSDASHGKRSIEVKSVPQASRPHEELRGMRNSLEGQHTSTENLKRSASPQQALFKEVQVEGTTSDLENSEHAGPSIELIIERLQSVEAELKTAKESHSSALQHFDSAKETAKRATARVRELESYLRKIQNLVDRADVGGKSKSKTVGSGPKDKRRKLDTGLATSTMSSTLPTGAAPNPVPTSAIHKPRPDKVQPTTECNLSNYVIHASAEQQWKDDLKRFKSIACRCKESRGCDERCSNRKNKVACTYKTCDLTSAQCRNRWFDWMRVLEAKLSIKVDELYGKTLVWNGGQPLRPGTKIIRYLGEVISLEEVNKRNETRDAITQGYYCFEIEKSNMVVDATDCGNLAKFANHSCHPNCGVVIYRIDDELTFVFEARQEIASGDPITIDYRCAPTFIRLEIGEDAQEIRLCYCGYKVCAWKPSEAIQGAGTWIRNRLSCGIRAPTSLILKLHHGEVEVAICHYKAVSKATKEATDWLREKLEPMIASENSWG